MEQGDLIELVYDAIPLNNGFNRDYSISIDGYYNFINYNDRTTLEFGEGATDWVNSLLTPEEIPVFLFNRGISESDSIITNYVHLTVETNETSCVPPNQLNRDWYINCSENCVLNDNLELNGLFPIYGGDLYLLNEGNFTLNANITALVNPLSVNKPHQIYIEDGCSLNMGENSHISVSYTHLTLPTILRV